ncbi:hypothetical protein ACS0TY_006113 [Phlomoides rotata]
MSGGKWPITFQITSSNLGTSSVGKLIPDLARALKRAGPNDVRRWYDFGALASICTVAPGFWEILELPDLVLNAVVESWHNNPHHKRDDELEIKFITVAYEDMTNTIHYPNFHFMKLQRPDQRASTYIKTQETKPSLVVNLTKDEVSTRRA